MFAYIYIQKFGKISTVQTAIEDSSGEWDLEVGGIRRNFPILNFILHHLNSLALSIYYFHDFF